MTKEAAAKIPVMNSVHLQPKLWLATMKPPMKGATKGPTKTHMEKTTMAVPLLSLPNMSAKDAGTTTKGAAPKQPAKKRQIIMDSNLSDTATAKLKQQKAKEEMTRTGRLPNNSDNGAQTIGPVAKPKT